MVNSFYPVADSQVEGVQAAGAVEERQGVEEEQFQEEGQDKVEEGQTLQPHEELGGQEVTFTLPLFVVALAGNKIRIYIEL